MILLKNLYVLKCVDRTTTSLQNLENKQKFEIEWILVSLFKEGNLPGFTPFQTLKWKSRKLKRCESLYIFKKGETYMDSHLFKIWRISRNLKKCQSLYVSSRFYIKKQSYHLKRCESLYISGPPFMGQENTRIHT